MVPFILGTFIAPALSNTKKGKVAASEDDLLLYRAIGSTYICVAREMDIEFSKAAAVAAITYVNILEGRHDGKISSLADKELTRKELVFGANNQLVPAAVEYCPKKVPNKTKKEVKKFLKGLQSKNKKK